MKARGQSLRQIAEIVGISFVRVRQILKNGGVHGKTLAELPNTEGLSPITRGMLLRMGYTGAESVVVDVKSGKLHSGCHFGIGRKRFAEIERWVDAQTYR